MIAAPAITNLSQSMGEVLFGIEPLASCEPFFQPVPVCNLVLADAPAEQDLHALTHRREVEESLVDVLDDRAAPVDRIDAPRDLDPLALFRLLEVRQRLRIDSASVACDLRRQLHAFGLQALLLGAMRDERLRERADLSQL